MSEDMTQSESYGDDASLNQGTQPEVAFQQEAPARDAVSASFHEESRPLANGDSFKDLMVGYDEDSSLQDFFPAIKEYNFKSSTFVDALPDNAKEAMRNIFTKLGFNQRQANVATMMAADNYCSGLNYAKEQFDKENKDFSQDDLDWLASDDGQAKLQNVNDFIDFASKRNFILSKDEENAMTGALRNPNLLRALDKLAKASVKGSLNSVRNTGGSSAISGSGAMPSVNGETINGSNYENFEIGQRMKFLNDVASEKVKDKFLSPSKAKEIVYSILFKDL